MTRRGNNFWSSLMRCNDILAYSSTIILPKDMTHKKWDRTHFGCLMHTTILIQYVAYKNFSHCWSIQDLEWLTYPSKGICKKLLAILLAVIFPSMDMVSTIGKWILRPSYLKIRLTLLDSSIIFKRICMGPIQTLYGQFWHFIVVKIHLLDD